MPSWGLAFLPQLLSITLLCWFPWQLYQNPKLFLFIICLLHLKLRKRYQLDMIFLCFGQIADTQQKDAEEWGSLSNRGTTCSGRHGEGEALGGIRTTENQGWLSEESWTGKLRKVWQKSPCQAAEDLQWPELILWVLWAWLPITSHYIAVSKETQVLKAAHVS